MTENSSINHQNIIARKRMEHAWQDNEKRYRDLYEEAPIAYMSVGSDGCILKANRWVVELLGYLLDRLLGRPVFDLMADSPAGKDKGQKIF